MGAIRLPLRRRSGSLIAPIALHWSLNGLGALADLSARSACPRGYSGVVTLM
ncbi:hypothetical protein MAHJHV54_49280 [Mycobacterium avium subsp. hominissuis]